MGKLERFRYLSDYYISLLKAEQENNKKGIKHIKFGVENSVEFTTGKIELADNVCNESFKYMIEKMIEATEKELQNFFK